jgi:putative flavoprotein involved in K+ transport
MESETKDLIIVGAGQAGLASAYAAREAGLDAVVLEASSLPAGSWPTYYDSLELFSPARFSSLPEMTFPGDPERYPTRDEVVGYLTAYASSLGSDIRLGQRVERVEVGGGHFVAETSAGLTVRAPRLIAATGGFGSPHRPRLPGLRTYSGTVLHSAEYASPERFAGRRVVVVGGGNSAVQIAVELAGSSRVTLATRSKLEWMPQRPLGRDLHWWLTRSGLDSAPIGRWLHGRTVPVLDDGRYRAAISNGRPDHRPMFSALDRDGVLWDDGRRENVDAVIMATGFRPHLPFLAGTGALDADGKPLHRRGISTSVPGLAYVGLEYQRTFASATLRGVGRDARYVVRRMPAARSATTLNRACCPALAPA